MRHWITESNFSSHFVEARRPDQPAERRGLVQDADSDSFHARSWKRSEFEHFRQRFKHAVELVWNNQIILLPPDDPKDGLDDATYLRFVGDPRVPANVVCIFRIQFADDPDDANAFMQVARLDREELPHKRPHFRPYHTLICNEHVYRIETSDHKRWQFVRTSQIPAAHEVGHWLGRPIPASDTGQILPHIDADTKMEPHKKMQYGVTLGHYQGIMGDGSLATPYEARPWLTRVERHTGALFGWQFIHRVHFPGAVALTERQRRLTGAAASP